MKPPALAIRLMQDAGTDPAAIGDLVETFAHGRSVGWFWRQAIAASLPSPLATVRWLLAFPAAVAMSGLAQIIFTPAAHRLFLPITPVAYPESAIWMPRVIASAFMAAAFVLTGIWVVPTRKAFIAACGLGIVILWASALMFVNGGWFMPWTFAMGVSGLLGGVLAYGVQRLRIKGGLA